MKMGFNDILEIFNSYLQQGMLIGKTEIHKGIGPVKLFIAEIYFHKGTNNILVTKKSGGIDCRTLEEDKKKIIKEALIEFLNIWNDNKEYFERGDINGIIRKLHNTN